jgi:hypothetical protein
MRGRCAALCLAAGVLVIGCEGGGDQPFDVGAFRSDDFPSGDAFLFGVVLDERSNAGLEGIPVLLTPSDGLADSVELESPVQAETRTNRRGEFTFNRLAAGDYVLFIRFDANHLGYSEVVQHAPATLRPFEVRVFPPALDVRFERPRDGGTLAPADTALLAFRSLRIADLLTVTPETRPLYARVSAFSGRGGPPADVTLGSASAAAPRAPVFPAGSPVVFETALGDQALERGEAKVSVATGGLPDPVRLESSLGFHVVYRDPRGDPPQDRNIRGAAISSVTP